MGKLFLTFIFLLIASVSFSQPYVNPDKQGQLWNVGNGYYGLVNSATIESGTFLDTVNNTTGSLWVANWYNSNIGAYGKYEAFDSARVLKVNTSKSGPYYQPYTWGFSGKGTLSLTANVLKASISSTVTPTVQITPQQSPNGINGWAQIPGTTTATVSPTSRTAALSATFNLQDVFQKYIRLYVSSVDTCSVAGFYNFKAKTY